MKIYVKILIVSLGVLFISNRSQAQDIKTIIDLAFVDPDNPLVAFDTCAIVVHVKALSCETGVDTGGAFPTFMGNLKYYLQSDKMGQHEPVEIDPITIDNDLALENMPTGGKHDTLYFFVDTALFKTTGVNPVNIIIVWPAFTSPTRPMCDSAEHIFWEVPGLMGIDNDLPQAYGSTVFPNPAPAMQLVFINSKYSSDISRVSIVNTMGQILNTKEFMDGEDATGYVLPTEDLRAGIYNIHIFYKDKKNEVVKFVKN